MLQETDMTSWQKRIKKETLGKRSRNLDGMSATSGCYFFCRAYIFPGTR
ncbi:unnamed protein product [Larinioides sclopetarius]|uniref:Uncharacterized protein n=1 Tax=Larinioides sclopetarius TaxID=280406 RepID=A0AAV2AYH7_9ARAC